MTTVPTTPIPTYQRRVIAPTATAQQLAERLAGALCEIWSTYAPLVATSVDAVTAGGGFDVAEQIVADLEAIYDVTHTQLTTVDIGIRGADGLGDVLIGLVPTYKLDEALDEHSAERQAHNAAHQRWMCAKYGIDPDDIDPRMTVDALAERCEGDKAAMVAVVKQMGSAS